MEKKFLLIGKKVFAYWKKNFCLLEKKFLLIGKKIFAYWKKSFCLLEKKFLLIAVDGTGSKGNTLT
ncbi:MAG: hypothetical protein F6K35_32140 [Okeania sp. SIO2H7]|nr:hypothetical protein [Okeania sp. SIO2H7]